jgi:hypothetical protein
MPSNSELLEEYGYKSHDLGLFEEWRVETSSILSKNPKIPPYEAAEMAYYQLVGSEKNENND